MTAKGYHTNVLRDWMMWHFLSAVFKTNYLFTRRLCDIPHTRNLCFIWADLKMKGFQLVHFNGNDFTVWEKPRINCWCHFDVSKTTEQIVLRWCGFYIVNFQFFELKRTQTRAWSSNLLMGSRATVILIRNKKFIFKYK